MGNPKPPLAGLLGYNRSMHTSSNMCCELNIHGWSYSLSVEVDGDDFRIRLLPGFFTFVTSLSGFAEIEGNTFFSS